MLNQTLLMGPLRLSQVNAYLKHVLRPPPPPPLPLLLTREFMKNARVISYGAFIFFQVLHHHTKDRI